MTFLTPIPALIAAAIATPALLLLYFLKLRRRPVRVSSTLLWIQATRDLQVNVPFRWLRVTWLFLLQFLILALFLLAMARPALDFQGSSASRVILLIDRSASMSASDMQSRRAPSTRLHEAQTRAQRYISELARGSGDPSIAVVTVAAAPEILFNFSPDRDGARLAIDSIQPTDQPGDLGAAVRLAGAMLAGDTDESGARRTALVVLFSDGGFGDAGYSLAGAEFRYERIGPSATEETGYDNAGIVAIAARRDRDDPGAVRLFARILNASKREAAVPLVLTLNGEGLERQALIVGPAADAPGQAAGTFTFRSRDGGLCRIHLDRPDALEADNTASLILTPAVKPRILVVRSDTPRPAPWVITNILDELELPYRAMPVSAYEQDAQSGGAAAFSLIIFDGVQPRALPPVPSLSFGATLPGLDGGENRPGYFISWRRTHPVLRDVSLDSVYVSRAIGLPESPAITELARGPAGPFIGEVQHGITRRLLVAFDPAESTWPLNAGFPIFLSSAIDYLTLRAEENAGQNFTTAEPASIQTGDAKGTLTLEGPVRVTADIPPGAPTVELGRLERAGVYRSGSTAIAVNLLNETESSLTVADSLRVGGETVTSQAGQAGPLELWPWLVLAALVLLTLEWFLNAWLMRA